MRIDTLILENFRTYETLTLGLSGSDIHLFMGPNGMGKTNLLEGISMLSGARSFLGVEDDHLVQWGKDFFRIRGNIRSEDAREFSIEVVLERAPKIRKAYFVNDAPVKLRDFIGVFPTVSFLPQDLDLLRGPPALRRRLIDRILCQTSGEYLQHMVAYARCLKQRNAFLRKIAQFPSPANGTPPSGVRGLRGGGQLEELLSWNHEISLHGSFITLSRLSLLQSLNDALQEKLHALGLLCQTSSIVYKRQGTAQTHEELTQEFQTLLNDSHDQDIRLQSTTIGPHRDDWMLFIDGRSAETWMSRGEQRLCIVTLFLLQAAYMTDAIGEKPIILLDDVFSELDSVHRQLLCDHLTDHQILITSAHQPPVDRGWRIWTINKGNVQEAQHNFVPSPLGGGTGRGGKIVQLNKEYSSTPSP